MTETEKIYSRPTPGPWLSARAEGDVDEGESFPIYTGKEGVEIATVWNADDNLHLDTEQEFQEMDAQAAANGRLIAAAPEMFALIEKALEWARDSQVQKEKLDRFYPGWKDEFGDLIKKVIGAEFCTKADVVAGGKQ